MDRGRVTVFEVFEDLGVAGPDCGFAAPAGMGVRELVQPIKSSVVDSFSDVDSKIEATVVTATQD